MNESVCVIDVSTAPLPQTGSDVSPLLLLAGVGLLLAGITLWLLARRRSPRSRRPRRPRRPRTAAATFAVLAVTTSTVLAVSAPTTPVFASESSTCALIGIDGIERSGEATNLLPGQEATALTYTVTNRTAFPVTLTADTSADDPAAAAHFTARLIGAGRTPTSLANGSLADLPRSTEVVLKAGTSTRLSYTVGIASDAGDLAQGLEVDFTSTVTATGP